MAKYSELRRYEFLLSKLLAADSSGIISQTFRNHDCAFSAQGFMKMFQVHNAFVSLDPIPSKLRDMVSGLESP